MAGSPKRALVTSLGKVEFGRSDIKTCDDGVDEDPIRATLEAFICVNSVNSISLDIINQLFNKCAAPMCLIKAVQICIIYMWCPQGSFTS